MNKHLKLITLILVMLMVITCFASCIQLEDDLEDFVGENQEDAVEVYPTTVDRKNYGKECYLSIVPDTNPLNYIWVEKSAGDAMSEAVYARQERVFNYIGVEVVASSAGNYLEYVARFRTAVEKRDGSVDCLFSHVHEGVTGLVEQMFFMDLNELQGIDLEEDYWNAEFMSSLEIDGSRYLGYSNINILDTYLIAFNKDLLDQYAGSMEKSLYQMVEDNEWTLDTMISLAQLVSIDKTNDGKTDDDYYGLTGQQWVPWVGFFHSSNINLVEQNESGKYELSFMNATNADKTKDLVVKLKEFSASKYTYLTYPVGNSTVSNKVPLHTGRALMELVSTLSVEDYLKYDLNFGVLPYPLYDQYQKNYRSLQWSGYICVPSYVSDELMVGETLEVMSFYSKDVLVTFYEKVLGKQVADAPEDAKMLEDYIRKNVCTDFAQSYTSAATSALYFLPKVTYPGPEGEELASYYKSFADNSNKSIEKFINTVVTKKAEFH